MDKKTKVLKVLEESYPQDLSIKEIAEKAEVSRETASKWVNVLVAEGKVKLNREIGNTKLYIVVK